MKPPLTLDDKVDIFLGALFVIVLMVAILAACGSQAAAEPDTIKTETRLIDGGLCVIASKPGALAIDCNFD